MSKKAKIITAAIIVVLLALVFFFVAKFVGLSAESRMTINIHNAIKDKEALKLAEYVADFERVDRNPELEKIVYDAVEKAYKSENYEDILFMEEFMKELTTKAKYEKVAREFLKEIKRIPHNYENAKNKAYIKGYWVREDGSAYKGTVVIVAGNPQGSLTASVRTIAPNYVGYKEGDPLWSSITFGSDYRFNASILVRTKDVYFAYTPGAGMLNIDKGTITISANGEIQNWRKAEYEEIKDMKYGYDVYKGTTWVSKDNSDVTVKITDCVNNRISFEVYNKEEDVKMVINGLEIKDGQGDFDSSEAIAGTIRIKGEKLNITFTDDIYTSGDYVLQ